MRRRGRTSVGASDAPDSNQCQDQPECQACRDSTELEPLAASPLPCFLEEDFAVTRCGLPSGIAEIGGLLL